MFSNLKRFLARGLWNLILFLVALWASLAIYYSNLPSHTLRMVLAIAFAGISIWTLWLSHSKVAKVTFLALFSAVVAWWIFIPPSHDRPWRPEVAVMPRASIDGDNVHLTSVRDFDYSSRNDFTVRYIDRDVKLSHLKGLDFYVSYWREGWVAHTFVSFIFDDAEPVSISIETRPEVGESFDPLASLFKQFELIYVVGEERDLVGLRASHRGEHVYLYHLNASPEDAQRLFMVYLKRINELADHPEFYHLLTNSCTINIIRYANAAGRRGRFDIRHLLNGLIDSYLYHSGRVDTSLSFDDLRRRSLINSAAQAAAGAPDFSERIRAALPGSEPTFDASPSK